MATHAMVTYPANTWTKLNTGGAAAGAVSVYPIGAPIWIVATEADSAPVTAPAATPGAFVLPTFPGAIVNQTLAELWPGIAGQYIWAYSENGSRAAVSCA